MEVSFVPFDETFLGASWNWLQDDELRRLINAAPITKEQQLKWYNHLGKRNDYSIWGVALEEKPIGVCGLKNRTQKDAEYWGYIGERNYWGNGIGAAILLFAEARAKEYGLSTLLIFFCINSIRSSSPTVL